MTTNMTKGNPMRLLLVFALPILIGGMLQQGYSLVDGIIVGQALGVQSLAAIGAVANLDGLVLGFGMMMLQGFSILTAQRFGAGDEDGLRHTVATALCLTLAMVAVLTLTSVPLIVSALRLLRTPEALIPEARSYIGILFGCMGVLILTNLGYTTLRALGDSRTPLICLIAASLLNIGLDCLFILVFHMGVVGAALGTVVAQLFVTPLLLVRLARIPQLRLTRADFVGNGPLAGKLLRLGLPVAIQNSIALVGIILLQVIVNGFGVLHVAAFTASMRIFYFMKEPAVAMTHAIGSYVGQNWGAGETERAKLGVRKAAVIMLVFCAIAVLVMLLLGRQILTLVIPATETETIAIAYPLLMTLAAMLPVLYMMYVYRSALQGMGNTMMPMLSGAVEMVARSILALTLPAAIGFFGVGIAETSAWLGAMLVQCVAYYRMIRKTA